MLVVARLRRLIQKLRSACRGQRSLVSLRTPFYDPRRVCCFVSNGFPSHQSGAFSPPGLYWVFTESFLVFFILNSVLLSFTGFSRIAMWFVSIFRRLIGFKFIFSTLTGMTFKMVEKKWLAFCSVPIGNNGWGDIVEINVLFRVKRPNTFTKKKTPAPTLMASHRQPPYLLCELVARFIEIKGET